MGGVRVGGLEVVVRVLRFFTRRPVIARWQIVLAFVPFCSIAPFFWPRESCGPDRGMPPPGSCLNPVTP